MKTAFEDYNKIVDSIPASIHKEVEMKMAVSNRIYELMQEKGLSKAEFARSIGKRPCEVTKWLSGQHNFTLATLTSILQPGAHRLYHSSSPFCFHRFEHIAVRQPFSYKKQFKLGKQLVIDVFEIQCRSKIQKVFQHSTTGMSRRVN